MAAALVRLMPIAPLLNFEYRVDDVRPMNPSLRCVAQSRKISSLVVVAIVALAACDSGSQAVPETPRTKRTTIVLAAPVGTRRAGSAGAGTPMKVLLNLARQRDDLAVVGTSVSDPTSSDYGHHRSVKAVAREYGASAATQAAVRRWFSDQDIKGRIDATASVAFAPMDAARAQKLFGVTVSDFVDAKGRTFAAATGTLTIPGGLDRAVTSIGGLSNRPRDRRVTPKASAVADDVGASNAAATKAEDPYANWPAWAARTGTPSPANCTDGNTLHTGIPAPRGMIQPNAGFTPDQLATAYDLAGNGASGSGQNVAVLDPGMSVNPSDIKTYAKCFRLPEPNLRITSVDHSRLPDCAKEPGICVESTLDVEVLLAAAPAVRLNVITTATISSIISDTIDTMAGALDATRTGGPVSVISASVGGCEAAWDAAQIDAMERLLQTAAVAGITVVFSAGDDGSSACHQSDPQNGAASVQYPASSPWVTAAGGTNLELDTANHLVNAAVWNDWPLQFVTAPPCTAAATPCGTSLSLPSAGGGGLSGSASGSFAGFPRPDWQQESVSTGLTRSIPDVAVFADTQTGYALYCTVCLERGWFTDAGTSAAAPYFAGMVALLNEKVGTHVGFLNPLLYQIGRTPGTGAFYDITLGNNVIAPVAAASTPTTPTACWNAVWPPGPAATNTSTYCPTEKFPVACCNAGPGYDMATGWGSPMFGPLLAAVKAAEPRGRRSSTSTKSGTAPSSRPAG